MSFGACIIALWIPLGAPGGQKASIIYEGNRSYSREALEGEIAYFLEELLQGRLDGAAVADAAHEIERFYERKGFPKATVEGSATVADGRPSIRFQIQEGHRSLLEAVRFEGNEHLDARTLGSCFFWERSGLLGLGSRIFSPEVLDAGIAVVRDRYLTEGFAFAVVNARVEPVEDTLRHVRVTVHIREGIRAYLGRIHLEGVESFPEEEVREALGVSPGEVCGIHLPVRCRQHVADFYRNSGYRFVDLETTRTVDPEDGNAEIHIKVREGPKATIRRIEIHGNHRTLESVIRRSLKMREGDPYNEDAFSGSHRALLGTGLFSTVSTDIVPIEGAPEGDVAFRVDVVERRRFTVDLLGGYGSFERARGGVVIRDRNLFGTGMTMRALGKASFAGERAEVEHRNPYFFTEGLAQSLTGFYERREDVSFERQDIGFELTFSRPFIYRIEPRLTYHFSDSVILDVEPEVDPALVETVRLSSFRAELTLDRRDDILEPRRGSIHHVGVEYAGSELGSSIDFLRYTFRASYIIPVWRNVGLALSGRGGVIRAVGSTREIPLQERFFSGGARSVRSYPEREMGPKDLGNHPIGGESFLTLNAEVRFPIYGPVRGVLFYDMGNLTVRSSDFGFRDFNHAIGTGLRIATPIGPIRFDAGYNPDRDHGEDLWALHFNLGYPF